MSDPLIRRILARTAASRSFLPASLALAALVCPAIPAGAQTAVNGQIAYVVSGPSTIPFGSPTQTDICVMNADGTNPRNLTNTSEVDEFTPAWSPDGTRIAFIADAFSQTLTVMNADGSNPTPIVSGATFPTWNPAGTEIAYVRGRDGLPVNIVIRTLATGVERDVTGPVDFGNGVFIDVEEMEPAWSPSGDRIAFTSVRPETMLDPVTGEPQVAAQYEIVTVNVDGTGERIVSRGDAGSVRADSLEEDRSPSWSPDGRLVVFMSQTQAQGCCGPWQIWAVADDGTAPVNLTNDDTVNDLYPSWSPDGSLILFSRAELGGFNLYTMPAPTVAPAPALRSAMTAAVADAPSIVAAAGLATPLTFDGNAQDGTWAPAPPPGPAGFMLSVTVRSRAGAQGRVFSVPDGIACGTDCAETYEPGTRVLLFALGGRGTRFTGWTGACGSTWGPVCVVTMNEARAVTATFKRR
ncbi:hypothetical protein [Luteitalea sp.]|uniref:InlB B-repeat-containing protein n=1 Tax=Luteitalea sp. TaxID=2004800 RepID=UPI0037CAD5F5